MFLVAEDNDDLRELIEDYLTENGYDPKRIAVERNGLIVAKAQYDATILQKDDRIEIVRIVGGG